jgi:hypothetical protein
MKINDEMILHIGLKFERLVYFGLGIIFWEIMILLNGFIPDLLQTVAFLCGAVFFIVYGYAIGWGVGVDEKVARLQNR